MAKATAASDTVSEEVSLGLGEMASHQTGSDTASGTVAEPAITSEQEYFLYELETSDTGSIGLVLRAIYDGGNVDRFVRALQTKIRHYDRDIERLCSFHFNGFIDAVKELLTLKQQCNSIRSSVTSMQSELADSSGPLHERCTEIVRARRMQTNIATAIDAISLCLPLLEKYSKLLEQMNAKRHYQALKTLEQLEHTYMPQAQRYRFVHSLMKNVTDVRAKIKEASFSEFKDFLESVRKVSSRIGELALKQSAEHHDLDSDSSKARRMEMARKLAMRQPPSEPKKKSNRVSSSTSNNPFDGSLSDAETEDSPDELNESFAAHDLIDYSAVYRCLHIFSNERDEFESYYREQRRAQANALLRAPNRVSSSLEAHLRFFHEVIGFFVVEDHIMLTSEGLVTRQHREQLWQMAFKQISDSLNEHFCKCTDPQVMLKIKKLVLLVALTLKGYGLPVAPFYKILHEFRDQYFEILMSQCLQAFGVVLQTENYAPIVVHDEGEYKEMVERFPFHQRLSEGYPRTVPFSSMVVGLYEQTRAFVRGALSFMEQLSLSQSEVEDTVRRKTNVLLERLCKSLANVINEKTLTLEQLVQIVINAAYLERSADWLDQFVSRVVGSAHSNNSNVISTHASHLVPLKDDVFRDVRGEAEQRIDERMQSKIDAFMQLAYYDWEMTSSTGRASEYITDLISFLDTTFKAFTNLPPALAKHACKYVCQTMSAMLLSNGEPKTVSSGAIEQFNLDVMQCELFAVRSPVAGLDSDTLPMVFADMRQLLDLFMTWDFTTYCAEYGKSTAQYGRVTPNNAAILLQKVFELEKRSSGVFARGNKDRRKMIESTLVRLRSLAMP